MPGYRLHVALRTILRMTPRRCPMNLNHNTGHPTPGERARAG